MTRGLHVGVLSLEPWNEVWRRNQHLAASIVASGVVTRLTFIEPPEGGFAARARRHEPRPGIEVITPPLLVPRRHGGHGPVAMWTTRALRGADVIWVNDAVAGYGVRSVGVPLVYDVTDDWREFSQPTRDRARLVRAEDALATSAAATIVCSEELAMRWRTRYGLDPAVIPNGVDAAAIAGAQPRALDGSSPHAVYVGTLHQERLDTSLVCDLARSGAVGSVHLVGPDLLEQPARDALAAAGVRLYGAVPAEKVPSWLTAADVLICPHLVTSFTLSLDAIKSHEYLATSKPVVATASSGFQSLTAPGLEVVDRAGFPAAVRRALTAPFRERVPPATWSERGESFGQILAGVASVASTRGS